MWHAMILDKDDPTKPLVLKIATAKNNPTPNRAHPQDQGMQLAVVALGVHPDSYAFQSIREAAALMASN